MGRSLVLARTFHSIYSYHWTSNKHLDVNINIGNEVTRTTSGLVPLLHTGVYNAGHLYHYTNFTYTLNPLYINHNGRP